MLKKSLFAVFGLAMALTFASPAKAQVAIGVTVGAPVYAHPVYPYPYAVVRPVPRPVYMYPRPYVYRAPVYYSRAYRPYWRHERFERHEYYEHHRRDWDRDHDRRW